MTRQEAKEILENGLVNASSEHLWCQAFVSAIDALEKLDKIEELYNLWNTHHLYDSTFVDEVDEVLHGNCCDKEQTNE